jgi:hypothetical protein
MAEEKKTFGHPWKKGLFQLVTKKIIYQVLTLKKIYIIIIIILK